MIMGFVANFGYFIDLSGNGTHFIYCKIMFLIQTEIVYLKQNDYLESCVFGGLVCALHKTCFNQKIPKNIVRNFY